MVTDRETNTASLADVDRRIRTELEAAPAVDAAARHRLRARVDDILRPTGALARLDEVAVWLAGWLGSEPAVDQVTTTIFAADHGMADLSAYPAEVTAAMVTAFRSGRASISAMASVVGAEVEVVDVGVGKPTDDARRGPAMSAERLTEAFETGRHTVARTDPKPDLLIVGEMGIGNTAAAAAVVGALTGRPAVEVVGAGTGVDGDRLAAKVAGVDTALTRLRNEQRSDEYQDPLSLEVVRQVGGAEVAAMAGAMIEARLRAIPVLLDGYVVGAAALVAQDLGASEHLWAGHCSAEPGHRLVLDRLGLRPLLDLELRLGEGSGAMAAVSLVQMACRLVTDVPTFHEWFGEG